MEKDNFDLNIYNYSIKDLKNMIGINEELNKEIIENIHILTDIKEKVYNSINFNKNISVKKKKEINIFLNKLLSTLKVDYLQIKIMENSKKIEIFEKKMKKGIVHLNNKITKISSSIESLIHNQQILIKKVG